MLRKRHNHTFVLKLYNTSITKYLGKNETVDDINAILNEIIFTFNSLWEKPQSMSLHQIQTCIDPIDQLLDTWFNVKNFVSTQYKLREQKQLMCKELTRHVF